MFLATLWPWFLLVKPKIDQDTFTVRRTGLATAQWNRVGTPPIVIALGDILYVPLLWIWLQHLWLSTSDGELIVFQGQWHGNFEAFSLHKRAHPGHPTGDDPNVEAGAIRYGVEPLSGDEEQNILLCRGPRLQRRTRLEATSSPTTVNSANSMPII